MRYIREKFGKKSTVCALDMLKGFSFLFFKALQPFKGEEREDKVQVKRQREEVIDNRETE